MFPNIFTIYRFELQNKIGLKNTFQFRKNNSHQDDLPPNKKKGNEKEGFL